MIDVVHQAPSTRPLSSPVREATEEDRELIAALVGTAPPVHSGLTFILPFPDDDARIAAFAHLEFFGPRARFLLVINADGVDRELARQRMLGFVEAVAISHGCEALDVAVVPARRHAAAHAAPARTLLH